MVLRSKISRRTAAFFEVAAKRASRIWASVLTGETLSEALAVARTALYPLLLFGVSVSRQLHSSRVVRVPGVPLVRPRRRKISKARGTQQEATYLDATLVTIPLLEAVSAEEQQLAPTVNLLQRISGETLP